MLFLNHWKTCDRLEAGFGIGIILWDLASDITDKAVVKGWVTVRFTKVEGLSYPRHGSLAFSHRRHDGFRKSH